MVLWYKITWKKKDLFWLIFISPTVIAIVAAILWVTKFFR